MTTAELIERLKNARVSEYRNLNYVHTSLGTEAATALQDMELDTLQALVERDAMRKRVDKLKNEVAWRDDIIKTLKAENIDYSKIIPELNRQTKELQAQSISDLGQIQEAVERAETAEAEVQKLRKALEKADHSLFQINVLATTHPSETDTDRKRNMGKIVAAVERARAALTGDK